MLERRFLFCFALFFNISLYLYGDSNISGNHDEESPGTIISVDFETTMSPEEIDDFNSELFSGYENPHATVSVDIYWVKFMSLYPDGKTAPITAQFFIPEYIDEASRSVYIFGSGSTGLRDSCRPSREHTAGIHWGYYRSHTLAHAGQGSIGIMPDYMGFGDPERLQYYMVAESEARVMLDAARALKHLLSRLERKGINGLSFFVAGFSQGGHAAFATADFRMSYAPDIKIAGIIGYGPTTDLIRLFREFPDVAPMVIFTYRNLYGREYIDPDLLLKRKFAATLDKDLNRMCVGAMQSYYPIDPDKLFSVKFRDSLVNGTVDRDFPSVYRILQKNSTGLTWHGVPSLILQGTDDIVVYADSQEDSVEKMREAGNRVDYIVLENTRHDTRQAGFYEARRWMAGITEKE